MIKGSLYRIVNKVNGKLYIGITYKTIERRYREHVSRSKNHKYKNYPLYKAMNKYGLDNFYIELIGDFEKGKLEEMETYYIKKYNTFGVDGYNATLGGEGNKTITHTDEYVIEVYKKQKTLIATSKKLNCSTQTIHEILKRNNIKTNNFNKASLDEIGKKYEELKNVNEVANYFGYREETIKKKLDKLNIDYRIAKIDKEEILKRYNDNKTTKEIADELNISTSTVCNYLKKNDIVVSRLYKDKLNMDEVIKYYFETGSVVKTAKKFNVERNTLSEHLKNNNINLKDNSKNVPIKICMVINDKKIEFDSMLKCAEYIIENNLTKNKSVRGIRDSISRAIKNRSEYLGYEFYEIN